MAASSFAVPGVACCTRKFEAQVQSHGAPACIEWNSRGVEYKKERKNVGGSFVVKTRGMGWKACVGAETLSLIATPGRRSVPPTHNSAARRRRQVAIAAELSVAPLVGVGLVGALYAALRAAAYFKLQYVKAALLARSVPRGGARVLDLRLDGKNLYYLPGDVVQVIGGPNPLGSKQVLQQTSIQAGVPLDLRPLQAEKLLLPEDHVDAVVCIGALKELPESSWPRVLSEAARVLKPGKRFIFVESGGDAGARVVKAIEATSALGGIETQEADGLLSLLDPHVAGTAAKVQQPPGGSARNAASAAGFGAQQQARGRRPT